MAAPNYTVDELRAALKRSALATIITEGSDDYSLMRNMQARIGAGDCIPAGGRTQVLALHSDVAAFSCPAMGFLADADLWLFEPPPAALIESPRLVVTDGYSIENDLLRDCSVETLLYDHERPNYDHDVAMVCQWFASGVTARLAGQPFDFDRRINRIIDPTTAVLTLEAQADIAAWPADPALVDQIRAEYPRMLRGKTWFSVLKKYITSEGRLIQHAPKGLLEVGLRGGGQYSSRLIDGLQNALKT